MISIKNILITGGAGFIGSNLCDYFIEKNNHITCLDNFATKLPHNSKTDTKHHLHSAKNLTFETACTGLPMRARRSASAEWQFLNPLSQKYNIKTVRLFE